MSDTPSTPTPQTPDEQNPTTATPQPSSEAPSAQPSSPAQPAPEAPSAQLEPVVPPRPPLPGAAPAGAAFGYGAPAAPAGYGPHPDAQPTQQYAFAPATTDSGRSQKVGAGKIVAIMVAAALVGGAAGIGGAAAGASLFAPTSSQSASGPSSITVNNPDDVNATTAIAAKVVPSVVTISASSSSAGGTGSGVILSEDGYVLTNTHVVTLDGATGDATISVTASDGKVYRATIVGTDPTYDLAVIKLEDASGLTPIEFADSSDLNVGDQTVAIGAPLGLSNTVTTGIVSALNRSIQIASSAAPEGDTEQTPQGRTPFEFDFGQGQQQSPSGATSSIAISVIQTDAAINPGNSGGALVDGQGKLIGINVAIASAGGSSSEAGSIGVGFSIPSNVAERVANELIESGTASHGLLGATVGDAAAAQGATISGALIDEVTAGGAAASAGLRSGDIVTRFNGIPITDQVDLTAQVRALAAGAEAKIEFVRDGQQQTATVTLGALAP